MYARTWKESSLLDVDEAIDMLDLPLDQDENKRCGYKERNQLWAVRRRQAGRLDQ